MMFYYTTFERKDIPFQDRHPLLHLLESTFQAFLAHLLVLLLGSLLPFPVVPVMAKKR
jgi:hypothetical protein